MSLNTAKATVVLNNLTARFDNSIRGAAPFYPRVCTNIPSTRRKEEYAFLGNIPGVREWIGDRQFNELRAADFAITNKKWEDSLKILKDDIADDTLGLYGPLMDQLGVEAAYHPDELLFTAIKDGESSACFDSQFFFDTDHSWGDSDTQNNDLTYNAVDTAAVTATEFKNAFHEALVKMVQYKNDQGKLLNRPTSNGFAGLMVLVPPQLWVAATTGLKANLIGGGDSNIVVNNPEIVMSPHLTDGTKFYLLNLGAPLKPLVFQAREPLSRSMKGLEDDETQYVKFMTQARYNVGYLAWWTATLTLFT